MHLRKVVTAIEAGSEALKTYAEQRPAKDDTSAEDGWKVLLSLFNSNSREELVMLLGSSKAEIVACVAETMENSKVSVHREEETVEEKLSCLFAEPQRDNVREDAH